MPTGVSIYNPQISSWVNSTSNVSNAGNQSTDLLLLNILIELRVHTALFKANVPGLVEDEQLLRDDVVNNYPING